MRSLLICSLKKIWWLYLIWGMIVYSYYGLGWVILPAMSITLVPGLLLCLELQKSTVNDAMSAIEDIHSLNGVVFKLLSDNQVEDEELSFVSNDTKLH